MTRIRPLVVACVALVSVALLLGAEKGDTKSLEGKAAPQFSLQTTAGKDMNLASEKGNVVLLDFWATWCPPCRASLPHLQKVYEDEKFKSDGLKVYAVNEGEDKAKAADYCKENNLTFPVPLDKSSSVGGKYLVRGIPTTVVIGRDGKVKKVFVGYGDGLEEQVRSAVSDALAEAKPDKGKDAKKSS
jgi:thiol-disulfide isomerase/thioredoxin